MGILNKKFGKNIKALREEKGLTQEELASLIGTSGKTLSRWECGNGEPSVVYLRALADALDSTCDDLLNDEVIDGNILANARRKQEKADFINSAAHKKIDVSKFTAAFRERVTELCKEHDMTIVALCEASGISGNIAKLLSGTITDTRVSTIRKIAKVFNMTLTEFFDTSLFREMDK